MNTTTAAPRRMRLTDKNVARILAKCLHSSAANISCKSELVNVEGIQKEFIFNMNMLNSERQHIEDMLKELPVGFKQGWSFCEMYNTKSGRQWARNVNIMEALMVLGVAIGKLSYPVPKALWWSLPGGMPYLILN